MSRRAVDVAIRYLPALAGAADPSVRALVLLSPGLDYRGFVPDLYAHLAACDLAPDLPDALFAP